MPGSGKLPAKPGLASMVTDDNRDERERLVIDALDAGWFTWNDLVEHTGLAKASIAQLRTENPEFKIVMERGRERNKRLRGHSKDAPTVFNPERRRREMPDFVTARMEYLGFPTPAHQTPLIEAWEDKTNRTILCLGPTGMGKDTTAEHLVLLTAAGDPANRCAWFMESDTFSRRRVVYGIRPYLEDDRTYEDAPAIPGGRKPERSLIDDFGPFVWVPNLVYPDGTKVPKPTWNQNELYFLPRAGRRERDPNIWATGLTGATYGSRIRTMVVSDAFTKENQKNPDMREQQIGLLEGTMKTRLDRTGRRLFIGTRVAANDNYGYFMEKWAGTAKEVAQPLDGPRSYTKLRNGVAIVIVQALTWDEDGEPRSYWPDNPEMPVRSYFRDPKGRERIYIHEIDDAEFNRLSDDGYERVDGLVELQDEDFDEFETSQQQNPPSTTAGEFTDELLNGCDDFDRTTGMWVPGEEFLIHGVDPAKSGGAAWAMVAYNWSTGVQTVIDFGFHTKLGHTGIRERLIIDPIVEYRPSHLGYETNREGAQLEFPDVRSLIKLHGVKVKPFHTGTNRFLGEARVSRMAYDMRLGLLRFPAATPADVLKFRQLKQHFKNYDDSTISAGRVGAGRGGHAADDIAMAVWPAWKIGKELRDTRTGPADRPRHRRPVPAAIRARHRRATRQPTPEIPSDWYNIAKMMGP